MSLGHTNFKIIRGLLTGELLDFLGVYAFNKATLPDAIPTKELHGFVDEQIPNTPFSYEESNVLPDSRYGEAHRRRSYPNLLLS
jgi:hypothetical protein